MGLWTSPSHFHVVASSVASSWGIFSWKQYHRFAVPNGHRCAFEKHLQDRFEDFIRHYVAVINFQSGVLNFPIITPRTLCHLCFECGRHKINECIGIMNCKIGRYLIWRFQRSLPRAALILQHITKSRIGCRLLRWQRVSAWCDAGNGVADRHTVADV